VAFKFDHSNLTLLRISRWGPDRAADAVKVVYGKNMKWLWLNPNKLQKISPVKDSLTINIKRKAS